MLPFPPKKLQDNPHYVSAEERVQNTKVGGGQWPQEGLSKYYTKDMIILNCTGFAILNAIVAPQEWTDSNMRWDEAEYGGVKDIRVPPSSLWKPDILMYNRSSLLPSWSPSKLA